jgi:hypothetical protein
VRVRKNSPASTTLVTKVAAKRYESRDTHGRAMISGHVCKPSLLVFLLATSVIACGTVHAEDPQSALRAYAHALEQGRADDAYRLLSDEARRGMSLDAFRRAVKDGPEDARELAASLMRPTSRPVVNATITTASGQDLHLTLEGNQWRIEGTALDLYAQDTPRHAVQGFVRAVERKRYDIVLKFVPDTHKEGLNATMMKSAWEGHDKDEIESIVFAVKQALPSAKIEEVGDHASLAYSRAPRGDAASQSRDGTLQLVRERGLWKIEDFD